MTDNTQHNQTQPETLATSRLAPKPWVTEIHAYKPGKSLSDNGQPLVKLSANENPLGTSDDAIAAMAKGLAASGARYPDPSALSLREAIARQYGLEAERIVCGTGSDELLNLAAQGYAGIGDEVIYMRYGFAVYDIAARRVGAEPVVVPDKDYATDIDGILAHVTDKTRVVFLANPNNPTGTLSSAADIKRLHAALPKNVLFVLDQAYGEYLADEQDDHGFALARQADNVLVTRTFSKIYGLAGQRVGWGYASQSIIDILNRIRGPFNVTSSGQSAAIAALADQDFVTQSRDHNHKMLAKMAQELGALGNYGLRVVPGYGNFLLVLFEGDVSAESAYHALMDAGYIVRWLPGQGLGHGLRITMGTEEDMQGLMAALRAHLEAAS